MIYNIKKYSEKIGLTRQRVYQLIKAKRLPKGAKSIEIDGKVFVEC